MKIFNFLLLVFALTIATVLAEDPCSQGDGYYPIPDSCDRYIECRNGESVEKLCDDGLLFNIKLTSNPCSYPNEVKCPHGEAGMQPPQSTQECPRSFGFYPVDDTKSCGEYKRCTFGKADIITCPTTLIWNPSVNTCDYPDNVEGCKDMLDFKCPDEEENIYERYADTKNCNQYYVCINKYPRIFMCRDDQAFNEESKECDDIENVSRCSSTETGNASEAPLEAEPASTELGRISEASTDNVAAVEENVETIATEIEESSEGPFDVEFGILSEASTDDYQTVTEQFRGSADIENTSEAAAGDVADDE